MKKSTKTENLGFYVNAEDPAMSAEPEMNKDDPEDVKTPPRRSFKEICLKHWAVSIKLIELMFSVLCIGFIYEPLSTTELGKGYGNTQFMHHIGIMYTTYTGFMVINCVLVLSKILQKPIPYITITLFALAGAALNVITCILLFMDRLYLMRYFHFSPHMDRLVLMTTAIVFTLINVFVYGFDAVLTLLRQEDF